MCSDSCKDGTSKSKSDDGVCEVNDMLHSMSTTDKDVSVCANCGKEGTNVTNTCNKCNSVKYCNAACKKKHRHKHKKECERRVAELHDEALFKQPPQLEEDCPICFLRMPTLTSGQVYMECCGKKICQGCVHAVSLRDDDQLCAFCRTPAATTEELIQRYTKRMGLNDVVAIRNMGCFYAEGRYGLPQDHTKALEHYHRAAELGHAVANYNIGCKYIKGEGVRWDEKKAVHYYELAAMSGDVMARNNLGVIEKEAGNIDKALKHWMIAIEGGFKVSLDGIKRLYLDGHATKDDYANALQSYQVYIDQVMSNQRDEAAAFNPNWNYY